MTAKVDKVAEGIFHIEGEQKGTDLRDRFVAYLVRGQQAALIEPGPASTAAVIEEGFRQLKFNAAELAYIIPTHIHIDHGGGVGYWAQKLPQAKVVLHPQGVKHMVDPSRLVASTKMTFGEDFEKHYGPILPVPQAQVHEAREGETLSLGERGLRIAFAPGHAPHHIALLDSLSRGLFCGEALGIPHPSSGVPMPAAPPPAFDVEQYLETAERLRQLQPSILFYSHDDVGHDISRLIDQLREHTLAYAAILERALKAGESQEQMGQRLKDYTFQVTGLKTDYDPSMAVTAFGMYFKRKAESK